MGGLKRSKHHRKGLEAETKNPRPVERRRRRSPLIDPGKKTGYILQKVKPPALVVNDLVAVQKIITAVFSRKGK